MRDGLFNHGPPDSILGPEIADDKPGLAVKGARLHGSQHAAPSQEEGGKVRGVCDDPCRFLKEPGCSRPELRA
ncbi:hypothetical protein SBA6_100009 [Candidatus Sulfopaludibacter sp. SbA6]|nr:hypothetical protein SBA6_100009 [Candidatus Sulfopaludibacter sp. SbA6]